MSIRDDKEIIALALQHGATWTEHPETGDKFLTMEPEQLIVLVKSSIVMAMNELKEIIRN